MTNQLTAYPVLEYLVSMKATVRIVQVGPFEVNCYLAWDSESGDGVIIDPGAEEERIIEQIDDTGMTPRAILLTHGHGDHIAAVRPVKARYDIPLLIGKGEEELLSSPSANVSAMLNQPVTSPPADQSLEDEQLIVFGSLKLKVLHTPGHSPAGVCYFWEEASILFCGDTLFNGSIGRTDFPGCSTEGLLESIRTKLLPLPDSILCYPGHGPATTIGRERTSNPFLIGGMFA